MMVQQFFTRLYRYLQGERRGMGHNLQLPDLLPYNVLREFPQIIIQTVVRLADVSFWQDVIDFVVMKDAGIAGVIIRAGQRNWEDSRFKENWSKAKQAGLPRGSYWFYDSRETPGKQAALWWSLIKGDVGELPHVADLEESYGGPYGTKAHMKEFIEEFKRLSGLPDSKIIIYTGFFWWAERIGADTYFKRFKLWLAWYASMSVVRVPAPWTDKDLVFWQYTSSGNGTAYGVSSKEIDLNYYAGDAIAFRNEFGLDGGTTPEPPPQGDPVTDYYLLKSTDTSKYRTIRTSPSVKSPAVTATPSMPPGSGSEARSASGADSVYVYPDNVIDATIAGGYAARKGDIWRKIYEMNGSPASGWMAEVHLGIKYLEVDLVDGGTPATPTTDLVITQTFASDGYVVASSVVNGNTVITTLKPK